MYQILFSLIYFCMLLISPSSPHVFPATCFPWIFGLCWRLCWLKHGHNRQAASLKWNFHVQHWSVKEMVSSTLHLFPVGDMGIERFHVRDRFFFFSHICIFTLTSTHVCVHTRTFKTLTHARAHTHTHTHTNCTHTHIHIHTYISKANMTVTLKVLCLAYCALFWFFSS